MTFTEETREQAAVEAVHTHRLLFRNRDYTGWWIGNTVSAYGSALSTVAYPLLILAVTGSSTSAGIVASAVGVGTITTMLVGGALVDRISRRAILVTSPLIQAVAVTTVVIAVVTGHVNIYHVTIVGLIQGFCAGIATGADLPVLRRVVSDEQLPKAFALSQGRDMAVRFVGPSTGGLLFGLARWLPFFGDAVSFFAGALGTLLIRQPLGPDEDQRNADAGREPLFASITKGLRFICSHAYLRYLTIWCALANAINDGLLLLVIVLIHDRHGDAALVGAVTSLGAVGGLVGAVVSGRIANKVPGRQLVIAVSWMMVASMVGIALVPNPWAIGVLLALIVVFIAPLNVVFGTYEARMIPDALMGRASSAINFGAASIRWLGPLVAGALASTFGPTAATLGFAGVQAGVAFSTVVASGLHVLNKPIDEVTTRE